MAQAKQNELRDDTWELGNRGTVNPMVSVNGLTEVLQGASRFILGTLKGFSHASRF